MHRSHLPAACEGLSADTGRGGARLNIIRLYIAVQAGCDRLSWQQRSVWVKHVRVVATTDALRFPFGAAVGGMCLAVVAVDALAVDVELADQGGMAALRELVES